LGEVYIAALKPNISLCRNPVDAARRTNVRRHSSFRSTLAVYTQAAVMSLEFSSDKLDRKLRFASMVSIKSA
jgi:hypothetical protein